MGSKQKKYPRIARQLAKAYGTKAIFTKRKISAAARGGPVKIHLYYVYKILTNKRARELARKDIDFLFSIGQKRVFSKKDKDPIKRLSILAKAHGEKMRREIEVQ